MSRGFSIYLDLLRFGAAFVVLMSHFAYERFSDGRWIWIRELNLGSDAVIVFFVLSGFVIALVAERKQTGLSGFAFDRITRLMSVALPALVLGYALDRAGAWIAPASYEGWYYNPVPFWEQLARGLSFSNEWGGMATRLGSNGPYWSLSYEAAFYALFAIAFYLRGARRMVLLVLGAWVFGVNILLLMPAWLMGLWLYRRLSRGELPRGHNALVCAILPLAVYAAALALHLPEQLKHMAVPISAFHDLRFSDEPLWNLFLALLVVVHLNGIAGLLRDDSLVRVAPTARWLAGGSFSLYLVHYPALQFFGAIQPDMGFAALNDAILLCLTIVLCLGFAQVFERPLQAWRLLVRRGLTGRLRQAV